MSKKEEEVAEPVVPEVELKPDAWFDPPKEESAPEPPVVPEEKKEDPKLEPKPLDKAEKRIADAQTQMHLANKKARELEKQNEKMKVAFAEQAEKQGVTLSDEDKELADVDPVAFATMYAERLVAVREAANKVGDLTAEEKQEIEAEAQAETDKLNDQIVEDAFLALKTELIDIDTVITTENINRFLTGEDHEELSKCQTHSEKFRMGYDKIKAYLDGIDAAKGRMKAGEPVPAVPSLSEVGVADPGSPAGIEARLVDDWKKW